MAMHIDHIHMGTTNLYDAAYNFTKTTGCGHYDGGFTGDNTIGQKIVPLSGGVYIAIESIIDPFATGDPGQQPWWYKRALAKGDLFSGLAMRVDTMEELAQVAKQRHATIGKSPATTTRPDGPSIKWWSTPTAGGSWEKGLPNWCCWKERMNTHPSGQPVAPTPGIVQAMGVAWLEMGGSEAQMTDWLGMPALQFPFRFNGKSPGVYAVAVETDKGEVVIRRRSATED